MLEQEPVPTTEVARWLKDGGRKGTAEDAEHGPDDDGWSPLDELRESQRRLEKVRAGEAQLEAMARERTAAAG